MQQDVIDLMRFVLRHHQLALEMQLKNCTLNLFHQTLPFALGLASLSLDRAHSLAIETICALFGLEVVHFAIAAGHYFRPL